MTIRHTISGLFLAVLLLPRVLAAESGLVTNQSQHSVQETVDWGTLGIPEEM